LGSGAAIAVILLSHQDGLRRLAHRGGRLLQGCRSRAGTLALANLAWAGRADSWPARACRRTFEKAIADFEQRGDRWHVALALQTAWPGRRGSRRDGVALIKAGRRDLQDLGDQVKRANCLIVMAGGMIVRRCAWTTPSVA